MATGNLRARTVRVLAPVVALASVMTLSVASTPTASADPKATIQQVEAQVQDLQNEAASAADLVNKAEITLAGINTKIAALKVKLAAAQAAVGAAAQSVDTMASTAYMSGGTDNMLQAMLADDPTQFLERAATLDAVSRIGNADLKRSQAARIALAQVKVELSQQQAAAAAAAKDAANQRAYINNKLAQAQALLSRLQAAERARLAKIAEARRLAAIKAAKAAQAREAEQAAAEARAQAAARQSSQSSSSGSSGGGSSFSGDPSARAQIAVRYALSKVGDPYSYDAHPPSSWDCSKLTAAAWAAAGVSLTAYSYAQYQETRRVSRSELRPGDLLFYFGMGAHHVMMYIGNGQAVSASNPSVGVQIIGAWGPWYGQRYSGAGRVI